MQQAGAKAGGRSQRLLPRDWVGTPPKDDAKPRRTIQSPKTLYKALTDNTKPTKEYTKPENTLRNLKKCKTAK